MELKELLKDEYTTSCNQLMDVTIIDYLRKQKFRTREYGRIEINEKTEDIYYEFVKMPLFGDIIMLEGKFYNTDSLPEGISTWFKEKLEIVEEYI